MIIHIQGGIEQEDPKKDNKIQCHPFHEIIGHVHMFMLYVISCI